MAELVKEIYKEGRQALVFKDQYGYYVQMSQEGSPFIETRDVRDHSVHYALDLAWNWVEGVIP